MHHFVKALAAIERRLASPESLPTITADEFKAISNELERLQTACHRLQYEAGERDRCIEIKIGSITLKIYNDIIMLEQAGGEAMQIREEALEALLQDYYAENF